jgi:hypothetical protein
MYPACFGTNPLFPNGNDFEIVLKNETNGKGVITYRSFEPGELVGAMTGPILRHRTQHTLEIAPGRHLNDTYFSGYFLHSCSPNVSLDMANLLVTAVRPIRPFEFITMDYAETENVLFRQFPCSCGEPNCRGWITGRAEEPDFANPLYSELLTERSVA